ncbi:MAG: patatin-like phospholipase family protein [Thiomargarita sp.]|nr:patatin-like phospholipase family protein [Thiomargarita sp.]
MTTKVDYTRTFAEVHLAELEYIKQKRVNMDLPTEKLECEYDRIQSKLENLHQENSNNKQRDNEVPRLDVRISTNTNLVGLAFSGGGIRAATFNLGLLQGLDKRGILRYCDYISTVSGGGYIGACLSSLLTNPDASIDSSSKKEHFPFRFRRDSESDQAEEVSYHLLSAPNTYEERKEVSYLRAAKNYLGLDGGLFSLDTWRFATMFLSGIFLINIVPIIFAILLGYGLYFAESFLIVDNNGFNQEASIANVYLLANILLQFIIYAFIVMMTIRAISVIFKINNSRLMANIQAYIGIASAIFAIAVGLVAFTFFIFLNQHGNIDQKIFHLLNYTLLGAIVFFTLSQLSSSNKLVQALLNGMLYLSLITIIPILFAQILRFMWTNRLLVSLDEFAQTYNLSFLENILSYLPYVGNIPLPLLVAVLLFAISCFININHISQHAFYRTGLSKTYIIKRKNNKIRPNEGIKLTELHTHHNGPYHLLNATLNLQGSKSRHLHGRGADYFLFSKFYCGAESTGYRNTEKYDNGKVELATAMAISGAAASPSMGTNSNALMGFYMILFNIRLNVWMPNPNPKYAGNRFILWPRYFLKEFFPINKENNPQVNLSDGGHHENLGIYSLLKRRCKLIIASEATSDPEYKLNDLANLQRKARIDLGINIELDMTPLHPDKNGNVQKQYVKGIINYPNDKDGVLFYIKTSMTGTESEDLISYRRKNKTFPDETTANQFFNEAQFESYRKLGEIIGKKVCSDIEKELGEMFPKTLA